MIWPWHRRGKAAPSHEAEQAHERASDDLQAVRDQWEAVHDQWPEVHRVADSLRELRRRNHFAEGVERMLRERHA